MNFIFEGQLKRKSNSDPDKYVIPLLAPPDLFLEAYKKIIGIVGVNEVDVVESRYNHNMNTYIRSMLKNEELSSHDLRRGYMSATFSAFQFDEKYSFSFYNYESRWSYVTKSKFIIYLRQNHRG